MKEDHVTDTRAEGYEEPGAERRGRRGRYVIPATLILVLAGAIWGARKLGYLMTHESTDDAYVTGHLIPVLARVGGYVDRVAVVENDHVEAGEILVEIGDEELREVLEASRARLEEARASVGEDGVEGSVATGGSAGARVDAAESRVRTLEARLEGAQVRLATARRDLERLEGLADKRIVPEQQRDAAEAGVASGEAEVRALQSEIASARAELRAARAEARAAMARLEEARSAVRQAELRLSYTTIRAPVAGIVSQAGAEPGRLLQPGQPTLTLVADTGIVVTANFKETQMAAIHPGQSVEMEVDAYEGCPARGTVESLGGATGSQFSLLPPENATGNFTKVVQRVPVRIRITEGCGEARPLRPGFSVVVHVRTG